MKIPSSNVNGVSLGLALFASLACDMTVNENAPTSMDAETTSGGQADAGVGKESTSEATATGCPVDAGENAPPDVEPNEPTAESAKAAFWRAFTEERYVDARAVTEQLEAALEQTPADAELSLLVAHGYLWQLSEFERSPTPDPSEIPGLAFGAQAGFERASAMAPEDSRIWGWLGSVLVGTGHATGDQAVTAAGLALIDAGVESNVEFNGFVLSLAHFGAPLGSPEFTLAQQAMWASVEACAGFSVSRQAPELAAVVDAVYSPDAPAVCRSGSKAVHGLEGFFLYFGDLLAKAGDENGARAMYDATRLVPSFETWPYRFLVAERETALQERLAAYDNEDPTDDPRFVSEEPYNCSFCHADGVRR